MVTLGDGEEEMVGETAKVLRSLCSFFFFEKKAKVDWRLLMKRVTETTNKKVLFRDSALRPPRKTNEDSTKVNNVKGKIHTDSILA